MMDIRNKLKTAWRDAFNGDVPAEVFSRLECENDIEVNYLLTGARDKTWEVLSELELRLEQEKFMLQFLNEEITLNEKDNAKQSVTVRKDDVEGVDNMYAKVNKPLKSKQHDSDIIDDKHSNKSDQKSLPVSQSEFSYEEIVFRPCEPVNEYEEVSYRPEAIKIRPESLGKKEKKKLKGSVRDKIKRFERTSSCDGDEANFEKKEDDYNKATVKPTKPPPPVSPRPAARKKQQTDAYEEIDLPCFNTTSESKISENTEAPSNANITVSTSPISLGTCSDSKHNTSQNDESSGQGCDILDQSDNASSSSSKTKEIPVLEENTNDTEKLNEEDHYAVLKDIVVEPKYSDKEPNFSSSVKSGDIKISARGHFKPVDKLDDDDDDNDLEGDYCSLSDITRFANKHVTLVEVKSSDSQKSDGGKTYDNKSKENTGSNLCIISSTISRSTEELSNYKDIDDDNIESINEQTEAEMKKLFHKKKGGDLNSPVFDGTSPVTGKKFKSLSSSDSDEGNVANITVPFSEENPASKPKISVEQPNHSRAGRKRVPDYEKWNLETLLTNPNISAAETENMAEDTGSEDDLSPYDNKLPTHRFEQKTVSEHNGVSDNDFDTKRLSSSPKTGKYSPQLSPQLRKYSTMSNTSEASRISTSCEYFLFLGPVVQN